MYKGQPGRITFLTTGLARAGAEIQVVMLALGLKSRGWEVEVVSMLRPEAFQGELVAAGIPVCCLQMRPGWPNPFAISRLAAQLRRFRPLVLHCHQVHANLLGRVTRLICQVPVLISTAHSDCEGGHLRDWAYRITDPLGDLTTHVSQSGMRRYVEERLCTKTKSQWVPNGIDISRFRPGRERREETRVRNGWKDRFVWLAVGSLLPPKDYPTLLKAFFRVRNSNPGTHLAIAGQGPLYEELQKLRRELNLESSVTLLGLRQDIPNLLCAADAFVMASTREGSPLALMEALCCGLPAVATRVAGIPELVGPDWRFLVSSGDPQELAHAMSSLMSTGHSGLSAMTAAARDRVATLHSERAVLQRWEQVYADLLDAKAGTRAGVERLLKRSMDCSLSLALLVLGLPIWLLLVIALVASSGRPVFFRQQRLGKQGKPFTILKFRTMQCDSPERWNADGSAHVGELDSRLTPVGAWLRRSGLDEIPQLWNVLKGDMSLVGPRPDQVNQLKHYVSGDQIRLQVRPGITGLAQVNGRNSISWTRRKQLDAHYVKSWSLMLDLRILAATIPQLVSKVQSCRTT